MNSQACLCGTPGVDVCATCQQQPIVRPVQLPRRCPSSLKPIGDQCSCANSIVQPAVVPKTCGCQVCVNKPSFTIPAKTITLPTLPALPALPSFILPKPHVHLVDLLKQKICAKCQDDNAIAQSDSECDSCFT